MIALTDVYCRFNRARGMEVLHDSSIHSIIHPFIHSLRTFEPECLSRPKSN